MGSPVRRVAAEHNSSIGNLALLLSLVRRARHCYLPRSLASSHANGFRKRAPINNLPPPPTERPTQRPTKASTLFSGSLGRPLVKRYRFRSLASSWEAQTPIRRYPVFVFKDPTAFLKRFNLKMSGARFFFYRSRRDAVGGQRGGELARNLDDTNGSISPSQYCPDPNGIKRKGRK